MRQFVIVVDTQADFMQADGALSVAGAEALKAPMQAWLASLSPADTAGILFTFDTHLPEVLEAAGADILFFQAGVDPLAEDALGRLSLTHAGLRERDRRVLEAAWHRSLPTVLTLGGGYAKPLSATLDAHLGTYAAALAVFR